jgi:hypothetical protein
MHGYGLLMSYLVILLSVIMAVVMGRTRRKD